MNFCADCITRVALPGTPCGQMVSIGNFSVYHTVPSPSERASNSDKKAILVFTDGLGLGWDNPRILADGLAREVGLEVWVPDPFNGKPSLNNDDLLPYDHQDPGSPMPWWKIMGYAYYAIKAAPSLLFGENRESRNLSSSWRSSEAGKGIGEAWGDRVIGGSVVLSLAPYHCLTSAVICHPGSADPKLVDQIDFPTSWIICEEDFLVPASVHEALEARLRSRFAQAKVRGEEVPEYEYKRYMGTRHGFASRPAFDVPVVKEAFLKAWEQSVLWLRKTML
ncbi:hypothetical protein DACRYDRAFT_109285 [Dacryopinax primogenitus]|uniref:Dienelactone hydrolase domain-containing protein n=1 Tax=Dacryopinax primogenitus (strain DJM 731) TaxID=1858805 RepID=M5FW29_DACPD|nr:uncharacterized protein DACRYDRAFT_109285 [Dacryopinax primogenitus]EJT99859.1 hypothetical protein DACRYDRAFT_109285 [Dacryopinax primogenitus]